MLATGVSVEEGVRASCAKSESWAVRVDGELLGIFGLSPISYVPDVVQPWLLTTSLADRKPVLFVRLSKELFSVLRRRHDGMINFVDARYERALRWARMLGFEVGATGYVRATGAPFRKISTGGV